MSTSTGSNDPADAAAIAASVEAALTGAWNGAVTLCDPTYLRDKGRNRVLRFTVANAPGGTPATVIAKASVGEGEYAYTQGDDRVDSTAWRFYNEAAGTASLKSLDADPPLGAKLYAADSTSGLIVIEDLGAGECLADRMQAPDRERLVSGLFAYARSLGRMHAATIGREQQFTRRRRELGGTEQARVGDGERWLSESVTAFRTQCDALGVSLTAGFAEEVAEVQTTVDAPGPFAAFSPGDTCPDNHRFVGDHDVCFFDFEFAGFRHALLDMAYLRAPFPTCWCVNRLPPEIVPQLEATYRAELIAGCPTAADDAVFYRAFVHATAYWTIESLAWNLEAALKEDWKWGIASTRQCHPLRLANFADISDQHGVLPAMGATARALEAKLRGLWGDEADMPLYAAFRG